MNYTEFCYYNDHVTTLTKLEIENPYLIIDELCRKRTMEAFHSDLRVLQSTLYRDNEWKKYNPAELYITYEDVIRLLDALFLINKHSPQISTILDTSGFTKSNNKQIIAINKLFKKGHSENNYQEDQNLTNPTTILSAIYSDHELYILKEDLFNCLQIGLDASYMNNTKHEYFGGEINNYALLFIVLEDLITEMYQIHMKGTVTSISLTSCLETKFSTNIEHPSHLLKYEIEKPYSTFLNLLSPHKPRTYIYRTQCLETASI